MSKKHSVIYDFDELAMEVLSILNKSFDVDHAAINYEVVWNAMFTWIDQYLLPSKMYWCSQPADSLEIWCKALGADTTVDQLDTGYNEAEDHLGAELDEMYRTIVGSKTWKMLTAVVVGPASIAVHVGEDYRIHTYMEALKHRRAKTNKTRPKHQVVPTHYTPKPGHGFNVFTEPAKWPNLEAKVFDAKDLDPVPSNGS